MITLRNKIGQMLIIGFNGSDVHSTSPVAQWLSSDGLGGVLLFDKDLSTNTYDKNLHNIKQIKHLLEQLNHYSMQSTQDESHPLLTAIDYEGGAVDRLAKIDGCMPTIRPMDLAQLDDKAFDTYVTEMALTLKHLGFNLNFAPVVDLHLHNQQGIIGALGRCFSANPEEVARKARRFVSIFSQQGMACCYKHFPGHGSATGDTHEGFVDVTDTFIADELRPYEILCNDASLPVMIMTAHVINKQLDSSGLPATLSHTILTQLLREQMGFDGVIISDDLQMNAIADHYSLEEALLLTINAGADMVIFGNQLGNHSATEVIDCIEQLVLSQRIDIKRIDEAYRRIVALKKHVRCAEPA